MLRTLTPCYMQNRYGNLDGSILASMPKTPSWFGEDWRISRTFFQGFLISFGMVPIGRKEHLVPKECFDVSTMVNGARGPMMSRRRLKRCWTRFGRRFVAIHPSRANISMLTNGCVRSA